jgi:hypothetical protein
MANAGADTGIVGGNTGALAYFLQRDRYSKLATAVWVTAIMWHGTKRGSNILHRVVTIILGGKCNQRFSIEILALGRFGIEPGRNVNAAGGITAAKR